MSNKYSHKYAFAIEIDGVEEAEFESCSDLGMEVGGVEYWGGGTLVAHEEPGRLTVDDVTLTVGKSSSLELHELFKKTLNPAIGIGTQQGVGDNDPSFTMDVVEKNRDGSERARTRLNVNYT